MVHLVSPLHRHSQPILLFAKAYADKIGDDLGEIHLICVIIVEKIQLHRSSLSKKVYRFILLHRMHLIKVKTLCQTTLQYLQGVIFLLGDCDKESAKNKHH